MEAGSPDDIELLEAWRGGDAAAGNTLFGRHFSAVNRFFRSKVEGGVEDLVQATFMACVEGRDRFEGRSSFRAYLFGIARHQLLAWYKGRRREVDPERESAADLGVSPSEAVVQREESRLLLRALRSLPLDQQITVELFYWEGLTGNELAQALGVSPHTVRSRLNRARTALREAIERLATDPAAARSTLDDLDGWALRLRVQIG
ncbi:MAG: sigma-70 family RNA polymerase sigma factor [Myxococcales bacterium]|nr:sigma-70 family RNA polymerase sigma factor [Myxococcales bacterium]MCB9717771.1 sigma-70 family RNA polymerase sigma factor [Myxococcales bacterium]